MKVVPPAPTLPAALDALLSALAADEAEPAMVPGDPTPFTWERTASAAEEVRRALQARPVEGWTWTGGAAVGTPRPQVPTVGSIVRHLESGREAEVLEVRSRIVVMVLNPTGRYPVGWPPEVYEVVT